MKAVEQTSARFARQRASRIREGIHNYLETLAVIKEAYAERDHIALGYESWQEYVDGEFGAERLRLPVEHRQKAVTELRLAGMSTRAIGGALGASEATVRRDLSATASFDAVDKVVSLDGRERPATRPSTPDTTNVPAGREEPPAQEPSPPTVPPDQPDADASTVDAGGTPGGAATRDAGGPATRPIDEHAEGDARRDAELDAQMADTDTRFRRNFATARVKAGEITTFDPARVNDVFSGNWPREVGDMLRSLREWCDRVDEDHNRRQRAGLRVVNGGRA